MFTHVMVGANDLEISKKFYDAIFRALGIEAPTYDGFGRVVYRSAEGAFFITKPIDGTAASFANGGTIGFAARSTEDVDAWHAAGLAAGGRTCEDPPGKRKHFSAYAAYLRDPVGNKLCVSYLMP